MSLYNFLSLGLLLFLLNSNAVKAQDTIPVSIHGCHPSSLPIMSWSYDSTSFTLIGNDSVEVLHIRFSQMCPYPIGIYEHRNDSSFITIKDTASIICLGDCYMKFRFRIPFPNDTLHVNIAGYSTHQLIKQDLLSSITKQKDIGNPFRVYPNPTSSWGRIHFDKPKSGTCLLFDTQGQVVVRADFLNLTYWEIDISDLETGVYQVLIKTKEEYYQTQIVKH